MEELVKMADSVMFSDVKIEQKFPLKHTIMDDYMQITKHA